MKKIFQVLAITPLVLSLAAPVNWIMAETLPSFDSASQLIPAKKKKKTKKNYNSLLSYNVSGDQSNYDASIVTVSLSPDTHYFFRRNNSNVLNIANLPPLRLFSKVASASGFEEENWAPDQTSFLTSGSIWDYYGSIYDPEVGSSFTSIGSATDHRLFAYIGGTRKKKKKRMPFKTYDFTLSGNESNADVVINSGGLFPVDYYYRKVAVPEISVNNMPDLRFYQKNNFISGFSEESWSPISGFFNIGSGVLYSEGALWIAYGYKNGGIYRSNNCNSESFKLLLYSDTKRKKNRLKKQYVKRYVVTISGDENNADKVASTTSGGNTYSSYYRRVSIPGLKMANPYNFSVFRRSDTASSSLGDAYSDGIFSVRITDGYLWVLYGTKFVIDGSGTFIDSGTGTYQIYTYK